MKIKAIIHEFILFPGELEKWFVNKNDYIFIKTDGNVEVGSSRIQTALTVDNSGLFQCSCGLFTIQNNGGSPVRLQGIKFFCGIHIQKNFYAVEFDQSPFLSLLAGNTSVEANCSDIKRLLENIQSSQHVEEKREQIDPRLIQLNRYIRKNYTSPITLQSLADYVGVHPTYLSNTYSKVFKVSPIYFVNQLRMKAARELLKQPDLTIKTIASMVGYNSSSQFCSIFKRFYAKSPGQYMEEALNDTPQQKGPGPK